MNRTERLILIASLLLVLGIASAVVISTRSTTRIVEVSPLPGSSPAVTTPIRVSFSKPVDYDSALAAFLISPPVGGDFLWEDNTLIFIPVQPFDPLTPVTVEIASGVEDTSGRVIPGSRVWSFTPRRPELLYLSPSTAENPDLWRLSEPGEAPVQLPAPAGEILEIVPNDEGARIVLSVEDDLRGVDIWTPGRDGDDLRQLTDCSPGRCLHPVWSPDGRLVAYERQESGSTASAIWLLDSESGQTSPLFENPDAVGADPCWSTDGAELAFFDSAVQAIRVVHLADGTSLRIPVTAGEGCRFSPDGGLLVYVDIRPVGRQYFPEIWIANLNNGGVSSPLDVDAQEDQSPVWSPDGRYIAFARRLLDRSEGMGSQLMLFEVESRQIEQGTATENDNHTRFAWEPGTNRLLVQRFDLTAGSGPDLLLFDLGTGEFTTLVEDAYYGVWLP
ncbi:MAG: PD40 domain-containing protein [Anaerolineae bacterium]|nr:PD40 domain-containing protein [Anaerolineae bacterium]